MVGDEDCNGSSCSETLWARIVGDGAIQRGNLVAADGMGGVYVAGSMDGTVDFGNGPLIGAGGTDIYLARLDKTGNAVWSKRFGDGQDQWPTAMTVDAMGNVYIASIVVGVVDFGGGALPAGGSNDIAVASFDSTGKHRWSRRYGAAASQEPTGLALTPDDGLIVTGSFGQTFNIGATNLMSTGDWDVFVAKLDQNSGTEVWAKRFGTTTAELSAAVAVDASGGIILVGKYFGLVNFGGSVLQLSSDVGDNNVFVLKLDATGNHVWSKGFGDNSGFQSPTSVIVDEQGSVIVAGQFQGGINFGGANFIAPSAYHDIFLVKFTSTGTHVWSKSFGGVFDDLLPQLAQDSAGNLFLSCYFTDGIDFGGSSLLSDGSYDIAVARFASDGAHVWSKRFGGAPNDKTQQIAGDIAWSPDGSAIFVTGSQMGTTDYGDGKGPLTSAGIFDAAVLAIGP
jgi:hypothetical protein